jgi:SnoaL-like domain
VKDPLAVLQDKEKIMNVVNKLFIQTDNRDWPQVKSCFAPAVVFDMSSLGAGEPKTFSPDDIVATWAAGLKALKAIHHQVGNYVVGVDDDKAHAFCYGIATHYLPNKTNANTRTFVGSYDFDLIKKNDDWLISTFKFNLKYIDGNLNLESS